MGVEYNTQPQVFTQGLTATDINLVSNSVYPKTSLTNLVSSIAVQVNGTTLYLPLLSAI